MPKTSQPAMLLMSWYCLDVFKCSGVNVFGCSDIFVKASENRNYYFARLC